MAEKKQKGQSKTSQAPSSEASASEPSELAGVEKAATDRPLKAEDVEEVHAKLEEDRKAAEREVMEKAMEVTDTEKAKMAIEQQPVLVTQKESPEERQSYLVGSDETWDGRQETAEDPFRAREVSREKERARRREAEPRVVIYEKNREAFRHEIRNGDEVGFFNKDGDRERGEVVSKTIGSCGVRRLDGQLVEVPIQKIMVILR